MLDDGAVEDGLDEGRDERERETEDEERWSLGTVSAEWCRTVTDLVPGQKVLGQGDGGKVEEEIGIRPNCELWRVFPRLEARALEEIVQRLPVVEHWRWMSVDQTR